MEIAIDKCVDSYVTKNKLIMKILFIIIFVSLFNIVTHAQKSQYFLIEKNTHSVYILPQKLYLPEIIGPLDNRFTVKKDLKPLMDSCSLYLNEAFEGIELNAEDLKAFHHTTFSLFFDKNIDIIYYRFIIIGPTYAKNILKWEKQLHRFTQKINSLNLKPYIEIQNKSLFKRVELSTGDLGRKFKNKKE